MQWRQDWGIACEVEAFNLEIPGRNVIVADAEWQGTLHLGGGSLWLGWDKHLAHWLETAWYPLPHGQAMSPDSMAAAAGDACLGSLAFCMAATLQADIGGIDATSPPGPIWKAGSGALLATARLPGGALRFLLDAAAVAALAPAGPAPALAPLPQVAPASLLDGLAVSLRASVGCTSFSLGELAALHAGDVLVLDVPLDVPLRLTTADGAAVCNARPLTDGERLVFALCP
jgi:flagellar motor switch/type III secretory pathway protein FliN